jgi:hypothetical protein
MFCCSLSNLAIKYSDSLCFFVRITMLHANTWDPRPVIGGKTCQKAVNELVTVTGTVLVVKSAKVAETSVIQHKMV